jgi:Rieske 2Fe-2S family protein
VGRAAERSRDRSVVSAGAGDPLRARGCYDAGPAMDHPAHLALFRELLALAGRGAGQMGERPFHVQSDIYCDPARHELERARVFRRLPLVLGHAAMLPAADDALTVDLLGSPVILTRGRDGVVRGFLNACRHRGARLLDAPTVVSRPALVCPYHNWTYGLDGALRHVPCPEGFPGLVLADRGLVPIPLAECHGLLFAILDPRAQWTDELRPPNYLAGLADDLAVHDFAGMHLFARAVSRRRANWKLVIDAFQETYHVRRLHRASLGRFFLDNVAIMEPFGPHTRSALARTEFAEIAGLPEAAWDARRHASFAYFLFPNTIIVLHPDFTSVLGIFPEAADESTFVHVMLTPHPPRDDRERDHWQRSFDLIEGGVFQGEDLWISEQIQRSLTSGANDTFLAGRFEHGIRMFHTALDGHLGTCSIRDEMP